MRKLLLFILILLLTSSIISQNRIYVAHDATGSNDGSSWANAYNQLFDAITASSNNDTIWVKTGVYKPNDTDNRRVAFRLKPGLTIYGGFIGTETNLDERDHINNITTLSGNIGDESTSSDNTHHIFHMTSSCNGAVIDGFTMTEGIANDNSSSDWYYGGALYFKYAGKITINNCIIQKCQGRYGGAVVAYSSSVDFNNTVFMENNGTSIGGVICGFTSGTANLNNCVVYKNNSRSYNGLFEAYSGSFIFNLNNCTMYGNTDGYSCKISGSCKYYIKNSTFDRSTSGATSIDNCHYAPSTYGGAGNISGDIRFLNPSSPIGADGKWFTDDDGLRITFDSPARNAGDNSIATETDITLAPRVIGDNIDIGAYEFNSPPSFSDQTINASTYLLNDDVISTIEAYDPDGGNIKFEKIQFNNDYFTLDTLTGELFVKDFSALDKTVNHTFNFIIKALDTISSTDATVTVKLHPTHPPQANDYTLSINENPNNNTPIGIVSATPGDVTPLKYKIVSFSDTTAFSLDTLSAIMKIKDSTFFDYEKKNQFIVNVEVSDGILKDIGTVTVNINNINESPAVSDTNFVYAGFPVTNDTIGSVTAIDPEDTPVNFSITSGNTDGIFSIESPTGIITITDRDKINFFEPSNYNLSISASDGVNTSNLTSVVDINTSPMIQNDTITIPEIINNGDTIHRMISEIPDGKTLNFSITGGDSDNIFVITPNTGYIKIANSSNIDYYNSTQHNLIISINDGINSTNRICKVNVDPTNEIWKSSNSNGGTNICHRRSVIEDMDGNIHFAFIDNSNLWYALSQDNGITWSKEQIITTKEGSIRNASITVNDDNKIFIAFTFQAGGSGYNVYTEVMNNISGSWVREIVPKPAIWKSGGNGPYVSNIFVDKMNIVHLVTMHYGWWSQGGTMWDQTRNNDTGVWSSEKIIANYKHGSNDRGMSASSFLLPQGESYRIYGSSTMTSNNNNFFVSTFNNSDSTWSKSETWYRPLTTRHAATYDSLGNSYSINIRHGAHATNNLELSKNFATPETIYTFDSDHNINDVYLKSDKWGNLTILIIRNSDYPLLLHYSINKGISEPEVLEMLPKHSFYTSIVKENGLFDRKTDFKFITISRGSLADPKEADKIVFYNPNDVPHILRDTFKVAENITNSEVAASLGVYDIDNDDLEFFITKGNSDGIWSINSSGEIVVADASKINYETQKVFPLQIKVEDKASFDSTTVVIKLNRAPSISTETFSIKEFSIKGTSVGTVTATDPDDTNHMFSIESGNTDQAFAIDSLNGAITVNNPDAIDVNKTPSFTISIKVSDGHLETSENFTINVEGLLISTVTLTNNTFSYDGTAKELTATTNPVASSIHYTYNGIEERPINSGSYEVIASINDGVYKGKDTATLVIDKALANISLTDKNVTFDGNPVSVSATVSPDSLSSQVLHEYEVNSVWGSTPPSDAGTYNVRASFSHTNYQSPVKTAVLTINKADQEINFTPIADKTYGDVPFTLTATGGATGNPVTFSSSDSDIISVSGNTATINGAGSVNITASQTGNLNYKDAKDSTVTIVVNQALATINLTNNSFVYDGTVKSLTATITPDSLISYITTEYLSGSVWSTDKPLNSEIYSVRANLNHPKYYALESTATLTIDKADQTISFTKPTNATFGDADIELEFSGTPSGIPVLINSSNTNVASVSGSTLTIRNAGTTTITASQSGNQNYNTATSVSHVFVVNKAPVTLSLSDKNEIFDGNNIGINPVITPDSLISHVETNYEINGIWTKIAPVDAGTYKVKSTFNHLNHESASDSATLVINKKDQSITKGTLPAKIIYGGPNFELNDVSSSGLEISFVSSNTDVITISGKTVSIINSGTSTIKANQGGNKNYNAAPEISYSITVDKATQTITFDELSDATYGDSDIDLTATASSGLDVVYNSDNEEVAKAVGNKLTIIGAGTANITASQSGNNNYNVAVNIVRSITVNKASQTITFAELSDATYGDSDINLTATASSGLDVVFNSDNEEVAKVVGNKLKIISAGTANITASQSSNNNYNVAANVVRSITVNKASQTITFVELSDATYGDSDINLTAIASSGLDVVFNSDNEEVAKVIDNKLKIIGAGTANITASQSGNNNYNIAANVVRSITVNKASQTITFAELSDATYGGSDIDLTATASSGLDVVFNSDNEEVAKVIDNKLKIIGAGTANITASQSGNNNYNIAANVVRNITVNKATQSIDFSELNPVTFGNRTIKLNAISSSGLPITYESTNKDVAIIENNEITILGAGTTIIIARQAGNKNYDEAIVSKQTLVVNKSEQTITFEYISDKTYGDESFNLEATASSNLDITYSSSNTNVATVDGNIITILSAGSTIIKANQNGNNNYQAAAETEQTLTVSKANQQITFAKPDDMTVGDSPASLVASSSSELNVTFSSSDNTIAKVENGMLIAVSQGKITLTASQSGDNNYNAANDVSYQINIDKATNIISETIDLKIYPNPAKDYIVIENLDINSKIRIIDISGSQYQVSKNNNTVDISALKPGIYFILIQDLKGSFKKFRLLKQ